MENQQQYQDVQYREQPNSNYALTIVGTLLGCCSQFFIGFIVGLVGIYFSSQVATRFNNGDYEGAEKASKNARILGLVAIGIFVVSIIIVIITFTSNPEAYQEMLEEFRRRMEEAQNQ